MNERLRIRWYHGAVIALVAVWSLAGSLPAATPGRLVGKILGAGVAAAVIVLPLLAAWRIGEAVLGRVAAAARRRA